MIRKKNSEKKNIVCLPKKKIEFQNNLSKFTIKFLWIISQFCIFQHDIFRQAIFFYIDYDNYSY